MNYNGYVAAAACIFASACAAKRDIQVEMVKVELVRVDTIFRFDHKMKMCTWQAPDRLTYYSFERIDNYMPVGTSMRVLVKR